jgi:hypothetical protein
MSAFPLIKQSKKLEILSLWGLNIQLNESKATDFLHWINQSQLEYIKDLHQLKELNINLAAVKGDTDLSFLSYLKNLSLLRIFSDDLKDIGFIKGLKNLERFYYIGKGNIDLSPLKNARKLKKLLCRNKDLTDISPLANLVNLKELDLSNTVVSGISELKDLTLLEKLNLSNTKITHLPEWIADWNPQLDLASVFDYCPLTDPPLRIVKKGRHALREYFKNKWPGDWFKILYSRCLCPFCGYGDI